MLRYYINSSIRPLRYFLAPSQAATDKFCVFDKTIQSLSLNKVYQRQRQVWKPSAAEFYIHSSNNYPRQYHYSVTACHQFSAAESGLKVNYVMEFEDVKAGLGDKSLVLIDVRNPDEIQQHGKIPGSINIPLPKLRKAFEMCEECFKQEFGITKPGKQDKIATHCMMGGRAGKAAEALKNMGFHNAISYPGSFKDWKAKGGPVEGGES